MIEKINIYIIGFDGGYKFKSDIYCLKKIKSLDECGIKLDAVFAKGFESFIAAKKYCLDHEIKAISIPHNEDYFLEIIRYPIDNANKKNLAALISEVRASKLNWLFKQDSDFDSHII